MFNVGDTVIATTDIRSLSDHFPIGTKLKITATYIIGSNHMCDVQDEFGAQILSVWEKDLRSEPTSEMRQILQPLLGLSDKDYDYLFTSKAASKGKTELQLLREYIMQVQVRME